MLKWFADITTLTEKDMSEANLKRLRIFTFLSMPFFPLGSLMYLDVIPDFIPVWIVGLIFVAASIGFIAMACSRILNRVWVRDQYLDEWELRIKHRSMAFGFQVIAWTIAAIIILVVNIDSMWANMVSNFSKVGIIHGLFAVVVIGQYSQFLAQLSMIEPIEEDELKRADVSRTSLKKPIIAMGLVLTLLILPVFTLGVIHGYKDAHNIATLADEAKSVCEARGSRVHWVSTKKGEAGFGCHDENKAAPEHLEVTEPSP